MVMNHQVWGLGIAGRPLLTEVLRLMNSLVSPRNAEAHCRFNARLLADIGLLRWALHLMIEAAAEPPATVSINSTTVQHDSSTTTTAGTSTTVSADNGDAPPALPPRTAAATLYPSAAVAGAGLDPRDTLLSSCALLLQRVLALCCQPKAFSGVSGACLSTLADGGVKRFATTTSDDDSGTTAATDALERAQLAPIDTVTTAGDTTSSSSKGRAVGNALLSGQALVRLYLLRMLIDMLHAGEGVCREGAFVCGSSVNELTTTTTVAAAVAASSSDSSTANSGSASIALLRRRSPIYADKARLVQVCVRAVLPVSIISILDDADEEAGVGTALRLLVTLVQQSSTYANIFRSADGLKALAITVPRYSAALPAMLCTLALVVGLPAHSLPVNLDGVTVETVLRVFAEGVDAVIAGTVISAAKLPYATTALCEVLLPCVSRNMSLIASEPATGDEQRAATVNKCIVSVLLQAFNGSTAATTAAAAGDDAGGAAAKARRKQCLRVRQLCRTPVFIAALTQCCSDAVQWERRWQTVINSNSNNSSSDSDSGSSRAHAALTSCRETRQALCTLLYDVAADVALCDDDVKPQQRPATALSAVNSSSVSSSATAAAVAAAAA
eukprot:2430-Heterococcus_DN1.PRE.1